MNHSLARRAVHAIAPAYAVMACAYCVMLFVLSSSSDPIPHEELFQGEDKVAHLVLYAGLAAIVSLGMRRAPRPASARLRLVVPILFVVLYGASDEFHQLFVPGRSADVFDLLADAAGGLLAQAGLQIRRSDSSSRNT